MLWGKIKKVMAKAKKKGPSCWKGYKAVGKKKSPSGKKTSSGRTKMVNKCVKK
tara:strand:- start:331 stop:489 length:159 start_codon:yes stop_codon:yes gene_type:complete